MAIRESLAKLRPVLAALGILFTIGGFWITLNDDRRGWLESNWDLGWLLAAVLACTGGLAIITNRALHSVHEASARAKLARENESLRQRLADIQTEYDVKGTSTDVPAPVPVLQLSKIYADEQGGMHGSIGNWSDDTILDLKLLSLHPDVTFGPLTTTSLHPQQFPYTFGPGGPDDDPIELRDQAPQAQSADVVVLCDGQLPSEVSVILSYTVNRQVRLTQHLDTGVPRTKATEPAKGVWARIRQSTRRGA